MKKTEAVTPPAVVDRLMRAAGDDVVLVGGQALGLWVRRYGLVLPADHVAISSDTDFLVPSPADVHVVHRFARALHGEVYMPSERAMTALVGQAYFDVPDDEFINVDVLWKVFGLDADQVRTRAVRVSVGRRSINVMHPLDVLRSRLANLYSLLEKQNPKGRMQLALAIDVAREFLREQAGVLPIETNHARSPLQPFVSAIEQMATEDAGRKVARRFGLHVADAIDPMLIPAGPFWTRRWPTLKELMSPAYAGAIQPPRAGSSTSRKR